MDKQIDGSWLDGWEEGREGRREREIWIYLSRYLGPVVRSLDSLSGR